MTRTQIREIQEDLVSQFIASVGDEEDPLVAGFKDGVEHMTKALENAGALKVDG